MTRTRSRELVEPYRRELRVHCYRMLGSLTDAEDVLQETLLAAWRGLAGFEGRASVRAWLYRIATNRCLNAMRDAKRRVPVEPVPPFQPPEPSRRGEITWLQPYPDALLDGIADTAPGPEARYQAMEAVELAFVSALQRMPPRQAATLVLRDVLGFPAGEVADMLDTTPTAVKGALQRARAALDHDAATRAPRPGADQERVLGRRFAEAFIAADIEGVVALLTDDAWLSMPPAPHEYHGIDAIAGVPARLVHLRPPDPPRPGGSQRPGRLRQLSRRAGSHPGGTHRAHHGRRPDPARHPLPHRRPLPPVRTTHATDGALTGHGRWMASIQMRSSAAA